MLGVTTRERFLFHITGGLQLAVAVGYGQTHRSEGIASFSRGEKDSVCA